MQQAMASQDFARCMELKGQINSLKRAALTEQMNAASARQDFETCIRLQAEIAALPP